MKRVIGIVSEGPTDQMAIRTVIDRLTGEKNIYRYIQPEQDARGEFGNGWKGVYRTERIEEDNQQCSSKSHK
jgi:hypothetical protein